MLRKQLMAEIRNADYTHAGEEEAITLVMNKFSKNTSQQLLDVGSGLGGTASYIKKHGWGDVTGIDIKNKLIDYANTNYADVKFFLCDVLDCEFFFSKEQFDLIYHFNSFYAFKDQKKALKALSALGKPNSNLVIFDYLAFDTYDNSNPFCTDDCPFIPINKNRIDSMLKNTGWQLQNFQDLTIQYIEWYQDIIKKLDARKTELINKFNEITFNQIYSNYTNLIKLFASKKTGWMCSLCL